MGKNKEIGNIGEKIAVEYLKANKYIIIEKNFLSKRGEIDIIAKDNRNHELVFIEVKTRTNNRYGRPIDAVDKRKMMHIYKAANYYIKINYLENKYIRFDVIEVYLINNKAKVHHIQNVEL